MNLAYTMQGTEILSSQVYCTYVPFNKRIYYKFLFSLQGTTYSQTSLSHIRSECLKISRYQSFRDIETG